MWVIINACGRGNISLHYCSFVSKSSHTRSSCKSSTISLSRLFQVLFRTVLRLRGNDENLVKGLAELHQDLRLTHRSLVDLMWKMNSDGKSAEIHRRCNSNGELMNLGDAMHDRPAQATATFLLFSDTEKAFP